MVIYLCIPVIPMWCAMVCQNPLPYLYLCQTLAVFQLPVELGTFPNPLTYVEWFTTFQAPVPNLEMYQVSWLTHHHCQCASIIPVTQIEHSIHLIPKFG